MYKNLNGNFIFWTCVSWARYSKSLSYFVRRHVERKLRTVLLSPAPSLCFKNWAPLSFFLHVAHLHILLTPCNLTWCHLSPPFINLRPRQIYLHISHCFTLKSLSSTLCYSVSTYTPSVTNSNLCHRSHGLPDIWPLIKPHAIKWVALRW